jgi:CrcB protein
MADRPATVVVAVATGGMLGATARYGVARAIAMRTGAFPWATLLTNLTGAFVLGGLLVVAIARLPPSRYVRPFAATGVLGGYTTFSTFTVDATLLVKDGRAGLAVAYIAFTLAGGLLAAALGVAAGRAVVAHPVHRPEEDP